MKTTRRKAKNGTAFSKEAIKSLKQTGALTATSRYSVEKMLAKIDFSQDLTIVELGVGNGAVTKAIMEHLGPNSRLIALEINENMYRLALNALRPDHRVQIAHHSAFELSDLLKSLGIDKVDVIVSTLPLTMFKKENNDRLMAQIRAHLKPNGQYIQIQYSPIKYPLIKRYFPKVKIQVALANFPPALLFFCYLR